MEKPTQQAWSPTACFPPPLGFKPPMLTMQVDDRPLIDKSHHLDTRRWLQSYPWSRVIEVVAGLCRLPPEHFEGAKSHETRELWERETLRELSLDEALRLCRRCQAARPFGKHDSESFTIIARDFIRPILCDMSATFSGAIVNIVGEYVRGNADELEMNQAISLILTHIAVPMPDASL